MITKSRLAAIVGAGNVSVAAGDLDAYAQDISFVNRVRPAAVVIRLGFDDQFLVQEPLDQPVQRARAQPHIPGGSLLDVLQDQVTMLGAVGERERPPAPDSPSEKAMVAKFVSAYESADVAALVALLTDDVFVSMPPIPLEYEGRDVVARLFGSIFRAGRRFHLVPTRANGQPAFGAYLRAHTGIRHGVGLIVLTFAGDRICAMTRFDTAVLPWFGLPRSLATR